MAQCHLRFRARALAALALIAGTGAPGSAWAHENRGIHEGTVHIAAGERLTFPVALHYHRVVGHVRTVEANAGELALHILGREGEAWATVRGRYGNLVVNVLVPCCKGTTWASHDIVLENLGPVALEVDIRLVLLHDGIAVMGANAEEGAAATPLIWFLGFGTLFGYRMLRGGPISGSARPWAFWTVGSHAVMWMSAGAMAGWGMIHYGGGPVSGTIAAAADLPWLNNPIVTSQDLVIGSWMILWIIAMGSWAAASRRAPESRAIGTLGIVLGLGACMVCLTWAIEYGTVIMPVLVAATTATLPVTGGAVVLSRWGRTATVGAGDRGLRAPPV
jgi:hypothetical protein